MPAAGLAGAGEGPSADAGRIPIVPESALKATPGILDRTVRRRRSRDGAVGGAA